MDEKTARALAAHWKKAITLGIEGKKEFQNDADECERFLSGPYNWLYNFKEQNPQRGDFVFTGASDEAQPSVLMTVNKVAELQQLFGPALYHQNPTRTCNPTELPDLPMELFGNPQDPMTQMMMQPILQQMSSWNVETKSRSLLMQSVLNYLPKACDLETQHRRQVNECLITGLSVVWTEVYRPIGANHKLVGSFHDSIRNLIKDPDASCADDVKWIARRCVKPVWEFEEKFGLAPGSVRGNRQSNSMAAANAGATPTNEDWMKKKTGKTNDLIVYYVIYSKMGLGGLLREIDPETREADRYGRYVQIVVSEELEYIVNLPEIIWNNEQEMKRRAQWETPFWADDGWPCSELFFHERPESIWPLSHIRPGLGELKFINWAFSFMASKMKKIARDFICVPQGLSEEMKNTILSGKDLALLEIAAVHGKSVNDIVSFLQHPNFNADFWKVIDFAIDMFEKRTGLGELMYGQTSHQYRSAAEADVKSSQTSIRPDDMAKKVEKMAGEVAGKEAIAARWHMTGQDIGTIFGPVIGQLWEKIVASQDPSKVIHQLQFGVEAGSARKRNKDKDAADSKDMMTTMFPSFFQAFTLTGDPKQVNALLKFWGQANDRDVTDMMFTSPLPPPMPAPAPGQAGQSNGPPQPSANGKPPQAVAA